MTRTWVPPVIPAVACLLLAALWGMSVFDGWGQEAFCPGAPSSWECADRLTMVIMVSGLVALAAVAVTATAWLARRESLFGTAVLLWLAAVGVLFVGGVVAQ
ncbi:MULTISPECIES: hypothetical protein [Microbispora]|uniref:hypothetical protein n=1 Tax=Microbispora TaxID=2005 RepID=UPI0012EE5456|nr:MULTISPECIES: hypothetical protein [Microbispora]